MNSCFAEIFNTRSKVVIEECQIYFAFSPVSDQIARRAQRFFVKYEGSDNVRSCLHYMVVIVYLVRRSWFVFCFFFIYVVLLLPLIMVNKASCIHVQQHFRT